MAMTYADWLTAVTTTLQIEDTYGVAFFNALAPRIIEMAEGLLYRDPDLDFLAARRSDDSQTTTTGIRAVPVAPGFIVVEEVSLIIPAGALPSDGTRIPLTRKTKAFIDFIWPTEAATKTPTSFDEWFWALPTQFQTADAKPEDEKQALPSSIIIAPTPDGQYKVEQYGTFRPAPLSDGNPQTFLTQYLPDLFFAASIVSGALIQRDMGATGAQDDPSLSTHWQAEYDRLKRGAAVESARQKSQSVDWTAYAPSPLATVSRTEPPPPPQAG